MPEILAESFPPLRKYCPILDEISVPQSLFLMLDCREAFYGGAAGGGKSAALLMAALQYVDEPSYAALLLRRSFPELEGADGLIAQAHEWLGGSDAKWNEQKHRWTFPSGATLQFGHVQEERDKTRYQGQAYQLVGFDELTHFTQTQYEYVAFSRARRRLRLAKQRVPIRARAASNPGNIGHGWVKDRFIDKRQPGVVFIPAKLYDNPGLDADEYAASLSHLPDELRKQLMEGDWGAFEGAAFTITDDHLLKPFAVPPQWERFESMDYGLTNPTAWLAWAVDYDGNLVTFDSHYAPGMPSETAAVIRGLRRVWGTTACYGDPASLATPGHQANRFGQPATIQTEFADHGLQIAKANNDPRRGFTRLRELLKLDPERRFPFWHPKSGQFGAPRWYIVHTACPELVEQLRSAPLTPEGHRWMGEMIDPKWEGPHGHAVAAARYGAMSRPDASVRPTVPADPRARLLSEHKRKVQEENVASPYEFV